MVHRARAFRGVAARHASHRSPGGGAAVLVLLSLLLIGCGGDDPSDPGDGAPPTVSITAPAQGATVAEGTELTFAATASDPEDGDLTEAIRWSSDRDGPLGTGGAIEVTLSPAIHEVAATVTDADGHTTTASVQVSVTTVPGTALLPRDD